MIITKDFHMTGLDRDRELQIYLPDDFETSGKRYPVMYINDGQNAFFDEHSYSGCSWGFLEYVEETGLDIIMVAIPCNFEPYMREAEYGVWYTDLPDYLVEDGQPEQGLGGEGDAYVHFIMDELKPYIDSSFPTDPEDTAIVGSSAGGNIAFYAALRYPEVFRKCAALSSAFWFYPEQYLELVREANLEPLEVLYFDHGTNEGNGSEMITNIYTETNAMVHDAIMKKEHQDRVHFSIYEGDGHGEYFWRHRVPVFMEMFYN